MIARMIVTDLLALFLSSVSLVYSADTTPAKPSHIQQPQSAHPSKTLRIFIEAQSRLAMPSFFLRRTSIVWRQSGILSA